MPVTATSDGHEPDAVLFGIVRFGPDGDRQVADTVITFDSAASANLFAIENGWADGEYQVTPLRFFVTELRRPVGSRTHLDDAVSRLLQRKGVRP
jgi:hypothetical protein